MIGAPASILFHAPTKLRDRHQSHPLVVTRFLQIGKEVANRAGEFPHQTLVGERRIGMSIEAIQRHIEEARADSFGDPPRDEPQVLQEPRAGPLEAVSPLHQLIQILHRSERLQLPLGARSSPRVLNQLQSE
jgi:hypothetical protein